MISLYWNIPVNFTSWFKLNSLIHNYGTRSNFNDIDNMINSNNLFITFARTSNYGLKLIKVLEPKILHPIFEKLNVLGCFEQTFFYSPPLPWYVMLWDTLYIYLFVLRFWNYILSEFVWICLKDKCSFMSTLYSSNFTC